MDGVVIPLKSYQRQDGEAISLRRVASSNTEVERGVVKWFKIKVQRQIGFADSAAGFGESGAGFGDSGAGAGDSGAGAGFGTICQPLASNLRVTTSPSLPCGGSFFPFHSKSRAEMSPAFTVISFAACTDFSADAVRVSCRTRFPSAVTETQESLRALMRTRNAPAGGTLTELPLMTLAESWVEAVETGVTAGRASPMLEAAELELLAAGVLDGVGGAAAESGGVTELILPPVVFSLA